MGSTSRRDFIKEISWMAGLFPFSYFPGLTWTVQKDKEPLSVHIFSKHLQFLDYRTTGQMAAEMGFAGVDLTVRPYGHVNPESVKTELPKAIEELKKGGSDCRMITTKIESVTHPLDVEVLQTAAVSGIKWYRTNWFKYPEEMSMPDALEKFQKQIEALGKLNKELNLIGCYQNHAGRRIGASYWEIKKLLASVDPDFFGVQYDIRHATVEGGLSWENGLQLLYPHIKVVVLKDFKWGKVNGKWEIINTPIGEGMVDFDTYFKLLKKYQLQPPVSLHLEYPLGGAEKGLSTISVDPKVVFAAMQKDLQTIQTLWEKA